MLTDYRNNHYSLACLRHESLSMYTDQTNVAAHIQGKVEILIMLGCRDF